MKVLMVGCGNMGGALLAQWARLPGLEFSAVAPSQPPAPVPIVASPEALDGRLFDAIVIAVKPQIIDEVMPAYRKLLRPGGGVLSIAAGKTIAQLQALFPEVDVVRMMPNLPAKIARGVTGLLAAEGVRDEFIALANQLAEASGAGVWVADEEALDRLTAISGCGSGYVFQMIESFEHAARTLGFADSEARTLVRQTLLGAAQMAAESDSAARDMKEAVMSRRGVTEAGIACMTRDQRMDQLMTEVVTAAFNRARAMAAGSE